MRDEDYFNEWNDDMGDEEFRREFLRMMLNQQRRYDSYLSGMLGNHYNTFGSGMDNLDLLKLREQNKHRIDYLFYLNNEYGYYESVWDWKYLHSMLLEYTTYQIHLSTKL